jgi:ABC-type transporter Mla maintaining outer membrane lipid asymmetry ATPase subunit MlaF
MTAGLVAPLEGTYRLFGQPMPIFEGEQFATRLRLGMVFDDGRLFNHLTVEENVALPLRYHGKLSVQEINDTAMGILDWMELRPWTANTPGTLAWSWQKRAALARAIALRPEVLLLDDPLLGLDARHASWWLNILDQLSKGCDWTKGRAVTLIVTAGTLNTWKDRARQFAVLGNNQFKVLGSRERVTESVETLAEDFLSGTVNS